jgi:DNA processing protein
MSVGTVVMQTPGVDGTMHTVRFTLTQGRLLFAAAPAGAAADEPESEGNVALMQRTGAELAEQIDARGDYRELLQGCFASRPVAEGLQGPQDHPRLLKMLEQAATALAQA